MHSVHSEKNYTEIQNLRFSNNTGSSLFETTLFTQIPIIFSFYTILLIHFFNSTANYSYLTFIIEFMITIFACVIFLTIFSSYIFHLYLLWFLLVIITVTSCARKMKQNWVRLQRERITDEKLPCITHFRGTVNIFSVICILAADFTCFPHRFLKTESLGFGLMDTGVGLFVVTYAFSMSHVNHKRSSKSLIHKVLPLFTIGVGRFLSTSAVNYQHQVSEYGTQWNFFITLSVLTCINEMIFKFVQSLKIILVTAVVLLMAHQCILVAGVQHWIMSDAPRTDFISGNREGIFSLLGYEVIYLFAVVIKNALPRKGDPYVKYTKTLGLYAKNFIVSILLTVSTGFSFGVSRRTANSGYIFWILSITCVGLIELILLELFVRSCFSPSRSSCIEVVPHIIKAVNFNGLAFFLVGNVLTGLINLSIATLTLNSSGGVVIISLYMLCCCTFSMFLYHKRLRLR